MERASSLGVRGAVHERHKTLALEAPFVETLATLLDER
jgi:hypothetical protein